MMALAAIYFFQRLLAHGCGGRATGEGFYRYGTSKRPNRVAQLLLCRGPGPGCSRSLPLRCRAKQLKLGIEHIVLRTINEAANALADEPDSDPAVVRW